MHFEKCIHLCNPNHHQDTENHHYPNKFSHAPSQAVRLHISPETTSVLNFFTIVLPVSELHINGIICYILLSKASFSQQSVFQIQSHCGIFLSLSFPSCSVEFLHVNTPSGFIHSPVNGPRGWFLGYGYYE